MPFKIFECKAAHLVSGKNAEDAAYQYLLEQGLKPVGRNFRCKLGELDILMRDGQALVIVEVRYRKTSRYGTAAETVTVAKQSRIIAATYCFLSSSPHYKDCPIRFDVVALSGDGNMNWIKNAF